MSDFTEFAWVAAILWILGCMTWFAVIARRAFKRSKGAGGVSFEGPLLNGIALMALTPSVSALHYFASGHRAFWGGAGVLVVGLVQIAYYLGLKRRQSDRKSSSTVALFREKRLVAQIVAIFAVYGFFGVRYWGLPFTPITATTVLIGLTTLMVVISIAFHAAIRIGATPERSDERDLLVDLRGSRNAYRALAAGVWCVLLLTIAQQPLGLLFYALMGTFALAELVRLGSQLFYYRFGV
jgi:hypothetical protein